MKLTTPVSGLVGCFIVISFCQLVNLSVATDGTTTKIGSVIVGLFALTGQLPSVSSGVITLTPFGFKHIKPSPSQPQSLWRDDLRRKPPMRDEDDDEDDSEADDDVQTEEGFHKHSLKKEDKMEKLKEEDTREQDDEESFQKMLIKQLSQKLAKDDRLDAGETEEGVVSMLKTFLGTLKETFSESVVEAPQRDSKSLTVAKSQIKPTLPTLSRSNRVKRQLSMSSVRVSPFYHVRDRVRSMSRPAPRPIMAPVPTEQFGLSTRDSSPPVRLSSSPFNGGSSGAQSFGSPSGVSPAQSTNPRVPSTGNSGSSGNSGSGGNKKGGNNNKNSGNKKPAESTENESGEDDSNEDSAQGPDSDEVGQGAQAPQNYNEQDSSSNEIDHDDDGSVSEEDYDD